MYLPQILLIDKPPGITSFDVIRQLRKKFSSDGRFVNFLNAVQGAREAWDQDVQGSTSREQTSAATPKRIKKFPKMGHAGTLDPMATGLMIIGVEGGTKQLSELIRLNKEYMAEICIGELRSTGDLDGDILVAVESVILDTDDIKQVVEGMVGKQTLPVSAYSAIKKDGKPMYERAREAAKLGELIKDVPIRDMQVHEAECLGIEEIETEAGHRVVVKARFYVGSGTYIRSLAEEIGRQLGYPATLQALRRTKVGSFDIKDAKKLSDF